MERFKGIKSSFIVFIATILLIAQSGMYSIPTVFAAELTNGVTITALDEEGDDVIETEAVSFDEGETAFDVLNEVAEVDYNELDFGPYITGINDLTPEDGYYWGFFVNGSSAEVGAGGYELDNGDNLLFKVVDEDIWPHTTVEVKISAVDLDGEEVLPETNVDIVEFGTAYDALVQATNQEEIDLDVTVDSEWLTFINDLDDSLDDSAYWGMYLNEDYMDTGLIGYQMQEGDHLELIAERMDDGDSEEDQNNEEDLGEEQGSDENTGDEQGSDGETDGESTNEEPKDEPESEDLQALILESIEESVDYLADNNLGWYGFIAMNALDKNVSRQTSENAVESVVSNEGDFRNVTDTAKNILILTAGGQDATDIEGYDLIDMLSNHERMTDQGNNGPIYSLLALNSKNYKVTDDAAWTKDHLIELFLDEQLENGGWALFGTAASVDLTGMALTALAPYQEDEEVKAAIDHAVNYLSSTQASEGGYPDPWHGGDSSPSVAMAIIGLVSVGMDPTSEDFTKEGGNLVQRLLQFQNEDGGFSQNMDGSSNGPASNQGLLGLAAYNKFLNNDGNVFDFSVTDEEETPGDKDENPEDEEEKPEEEDPADKTEKIIHPETTINKEKKEMTAKIDLDDISDITENKVIVQPENTSDQLVFDVEISNKALNKLVDTNSDLTIDKGDVGLHIPNKVLQHILEEAGDQSVNIKLVKYEASQALGSVYDFTITAGNQTISDFNGEEITLNFQVDQELAANINPDRIKAFYFNEDTDEWEVIENSVYNPETGLVTAKTTHFSIFGVFEIGATTDVIPTIAEPESTNDEDETGAKNETDENEDNTDENGSLGENTTDGETGSKLPDTATNSFNYMLIGLALLLTGIIIFIVKRRMQLKS